jgi:hypothetical protein
MTEAGPNTFLRCNNEASADWVAMPVFEFLDCLVVVPFVVGLARAKTWVRDPPRATADFLRE